MLIEAFQIAAHSWGLCTINSMRTEQEGENIELVFICCVIFAGEKKKHDTHNTLC